MGSHGHPAADLGAPPVLAARAVGLAALIALPAGLVIGHTGRAEPGAFVPVGHRRGPSRTLGLLVLLGRWYPGSGVARRSSSSPCWPSRRYSPTPQPASVASIPERVDAAQGMGMTPLQVLRGSRCRSAAPLILAGVGSALLQVFATATIAAFAGLRRARPIHHRRVRRQRRRPGLRRLDRRRRARLGRARVLFALAQRSAHVHRASPPPSALALSHSSLSPQPGGSQTHEATPVCSPPSRPSPLSPQRAATTTTTTPLPATMPLPATSQAEPHHRLGQLPGESSCSPRSTRARWRPGRRGDRGAEHRLPRGLLPGHRNRRDRPAAGVHELPAVVRSAPGRSRSDSRRPPTSRSSSPSSRTCCPTT